MPRATTCCEQWDAAAQECEQAVQLDGQNSDDHLWLGRALGEKAGRASFLSAFSLGKRVRAEFEEAVRLNPRNAEALTDLGEFYQAGAREWWAAARTRPRESPRSWTKWIRRAPTSCGRVSPRQRKDYGTAEREFKQAIAASRTSGLHWIDAGQLLSPTAQRWTEMESAIHSCVTAAASETSTRAWRSTTAPAC